MTPKKFPAAKKLPPMGLAPGSSGLSISSTTGEFEDPPK